MIARVRSRMVPSRQSDSSEGNGSLFFSEVMILVPKTENPVKELLKADFSTFLCDVVASVFSISGMRILKGNHQ